MKLKKIISLALALVMALALSVPAMAAEETAEANSLIYTKENTWQDSIKGYTEAREVTFTGDFFCIKQADATYIWVSDAAFEAGTDYSAYCTGNPEYTEVVHGEGTFYFSNMNLPDGMNKQPLANTWFTVSGDSLTISGKISHVNALPGTIVDDGETSTVTTGKLDVNIGSVVQEYIKQVHENEYKLYSEGTLVSHIASVSGASLPAGITGSYLKNGMTYLTISKAALAAAGEDGVNIGIATSDPQKGGKTSWNTPAPAPLGETEQPSYNLKIEDGKLVVTSDLPNIGVCLYGAKGTVNGPKDVKHLTGETSASYDIPADTFKFFIHIEDTEYYTNEIIGCKLVSSQVLEKAFECEPTITVTDAMGSEVDHAEPLEAGGYTVTVTIGEDTWTKTVEVIAGETVTADFGKLTVSGMGEPVIECPQECGAIKMIPLTPATPVEP